MASSLPAHVSDYTVYNVSIIQSEELKALAFM